MFNPVIIYLILKAFSAYQTENFLLSIIAFHALLAGICFLSYRYFEMPFLRLKEKYAVVKSGGVVSPESIQVEESAGKELAEPVLIQKSE
jgi:peptidoglycan/LPS O-acetylase OafA/YrhL